MTFKLTRLAAAARRPVRVRRDFVPGVMFFSPRPPTRMELIAIASLFVISWIAVALFGLSALVPKRWRVAGAVLLTVLAIAALWWGLQPDAGS